MKIRIILNDLGKYKVQSKCLWWWHTHTVYENLGCWRDSFDSIHAARSLVYDVLSKHRKSKAVGFKVVQEIIE